MSSASARSSRRVATRNAGDATAEIAAIYVDPDSWRSGAGAALLNVALPKLSDDGWREVTLWVFAANTQARRFDEQFGFAADGREKLDEHSGQSEVRLRLSPAAVRGQAGAQ